MPSPTRVFSRAACVFPLGVLAELHVAADRHEIDDVFGEQVEPVAKTSFVQKFGFVEKKIFHVHAQVVARAARIRVFQHVGHQALLSCGRPAFGIGPP